MNTNTKMRRGDWPAPGYTLKVQRERECALCGETFGSIRPSHRFCSDTCKAEAALILAVLEGRSRKYDSLPARLAAATGAPSTAAGRMLAAIDRRRHERSWRRAIGDIGGQERAAKLEHVRDRGERGG